MPSIKVSLSVVLDESSDELQQRPGERETNSKTTFFVEKGKRHDVMPLPLTVNLFENVEVMSISTIVTLDGTYRFILQSRCIQGWISLRKMTGTMAAS
jgi:hypothetical protein